MAEALAQAAGKQQEMMEEMQARIDIMNTTSIVSEADLKGDIITINEKYREISKYSEKELIGSPHSITRHPDMPKETFKSMWKTIGRGEIFRGIIKNRAKDGTPYYVDAVIKPIMGPNDKPRKYLGVRYDITQYELARQNMKGIVDAIDASYATIEFDLKGNVLTANNVFLQTMGYSLDEIKGKHHSQFVELDIPRSELRGMSSSVSSAQLDGRSVPHQESSGPDFLSECHDLLRPADSGNTGQEVPPPSEAGRLSLHRAFRESPMGGSRVQIVGPDDLSEGTLTSMALTQTDHFAHIRRMRDSRFPHEIAAILPGEFFVSPDPMIVYTVLGSCVSACVRDPVAGVGGMNHFMLPKPKDVGNDSWGESTRYGSYAMESLI